MQFFVLCTIKHGIFSQHLNGAATDLAMPPEAKQGSGFLGPFSRLFLGLCNSFSSCQPLNPFAIGRRLFKLLFQC